MADDSHAESGCFESGSDIDNARNQYFVPFQMLLFDRNRVPARERTDYPEKSIEFARTVAEGDLVALHTHQTWPENEEHVTMDFFRFDESGRIVEHWDSMQQVPAESKNGNPMY